MFKPELGTLRGYEVKFSVDSEAQTRFHKARPVPYAMEGKMEGELDHLHKEEIIELVQFVLLSTWATRLMLKVFIQYQKKLKPSRKHHGHRMLVN